MTKLYLMFSAALFVLLGACGSEPPPTAATPAVTVVTLQAEDLTLTRELPGRVSASRVAEIRPQVSGILRQRLFVEGSKVAAGELLYQIEDGTYRADLSSAQAALQRANAVFDLARRTADRSAGLVKAEAVSAEDNDNALAALAQAQAEVALAKAELSRSEIVLAYTRITAPISGWIGKSKLTEGALLSADQTDLLATVQQLDPVYVDVTRAGAELLALRRQLATGTLSSDDTLPVTILLEDGSHYAHQGELAFSDVSVDPSTGTYALRISVPNPEKLLMPGMYVRAIIAEGLRRDAVLAPQQGISHDPKGNATAMVVAPDGTIEMREVGVSKTIGDRWLVEDGLVAGDKVVVAGLQKIKPGMVVTQVAERGADVGAGVQSQPPADAATTPISAN